MKGKTVLVTGATNGIGLAAARALAAQGACVLAHGRSPERAAAAAREISKATGGDVRPVHADFASLADVRRLGEDLARDLPRLDVLLNNAGHANASRKLSADGHELTFAVNHLAPFLLTNLLLDKLKASAPARVVTVSSAAHHSGRIDFADLQGHSRSPTFIYGDTKLANLLFARALARRLEGSGVTSNALHPGAVRTGFGQDGGVLTLVFKLVAPLLSSPEQGAATSIYLASSPAVEGRSGGYYAKCKPAKISKAAADDEAGEQLWRESEKLVGLG